MRNQLLVWIAMMIAIAHPIWNAIARSLLSGELWIGYMYATYGRSSTCDLSFECVPTIHVLHGAPERYMPRAASGGRCTKRPVWVVAIVNDTTPPTIRSASAATTAQNTRTIHGSCQSREKLQFASESRVWNKARASGVIVGEAWTDRSELILAIVIFFKRLKKSAVSN